jgi:hypothetical protein
MALVAVVSLPAHAQSLVESAAAAKAAHATGMGWPAPANGVSTAAATVATLKTPTGAGVDAKTTDDPIPVEPSVGTLAENRRKATTLLGARIDALREKVPTRIQLAAQYRDACAGKETSAGWTLRGQLITTPNAETPQCRTIASDLQTLTRAIALEHDALTELARRNGILPGVQRELQIPE